MKMHRITKKLFSCSVLPLLIVIALNADHSYADVIMGTITNRPESVGERSIGDGINDVHAGWSINTFDKGWFYATGDSDVAHAEGITAISQITDAGIYSFTSSVVGPFCDADCDPDGVGEFIVWRNKNGYYGVLRIDNIVVEGVDISTATLNGTWWFQTDGTPNFNPSGVGVNDLVTFEPIPSTFTFAPDPTGCPEGFVGKFSFAAQLTNISDSSLTDLVVAVTTLTNGNLLQNADGGPGGVGVQLTVPQQDGFTDGMLSPDEFVNVPFIICLQEKSPFSFVVDVLGVTPTQIILPYLSPGYRFLVVPFGQGAGFEQPNFDDAQFAVGHAAFGTGSFCPLDSTVETAWPLETDILLRKTFTLPANASSVRVAVAIDNDVQVFVNGVDISGGLQENEGCAEPDRFVFSVPDSLLIFGGENLLAVRGRDRGVISYIDVEVRADIPLF